VGRAQQRIHGQQEEHHHAKDRDRQQMPDQRGLLNEKIVEIGRRGDRQRQQCSEGKGACGHDESARGDLACRHAAA